jgi:hypothetical protein
MRIRVRGAEAIRVQRLNDGMAQLWTMRELNGVMFAGHRHVNIKRQALLFDKIQIWRNSGPANERTEEFEAEISFLKERGVVEAAMLEAKEFAEAGADAIGQYAEIDYDLDPPEEGVGSRRSSLSGSEQSSHRLEDSRKDRR